jgi:hypothetical protein
MRLDILVRNSVLGVALAGFMGTGAAAQDKDAAKDAAKAEKDATKDAAKAQKDAAKDAKVKKDKDRDPSASTNKTKGSHKAKGHSH